MTVNLAEGEVAVCPFTNFEEQVLPPTASITIIKHTTPGDGAAFSFASSKGGPAVLTLSDDHTKAFTELEAGTYSVTKGARR